MMTKNKITFNELITKLIEDSESYNNYYCLGKDQSKDSYVDQQRKKFEKRIKRVGLEPNVFKENKKYMFYEHSLMYVKKILEYDMKSINRKLNKQFIPKHEDTLKDDVLFFCTFLEDYLDGEELDYAVKQVHEKLQ